MATPLVGIGDVVAHKYIIEHIIGQGGMGVVFAARHGELERRVAIKFLLPEFAEQSMAAERFRREARAAARMRGEHVCRVLDVGTLGTGIPFMVMEYLEGHDLASELGARGKLPIDEAVSYVLEACEAVAEAHVAGIIHRDLKPANLFLENRADGSRRVKVLDFGVSKSLLELKDGRSALTRTSNLVGSPLYMSPEQLDSARDVDARADVWALGVVLFELLTGDPPFQGETIPQLVAAVLQDTPLRTSQLRATLPPGLVQVLERALAKPREQRYASVADLAEALGGFAPPTAAGSITRVRRIIESKPPSGDRESPSRAPGASASATPIQDAPSGDDATIAGADRVRAAKRRWLIGGMGLAFVLAAVAYFAWRGQEPLAARSADAARPSDPAQPSAADPLGADAPLPLEQNARAVAGGAGTGPSVIEPVAPAPAPVNDVAAVASPSGEARPGAVVAGETLRETSHPEAPVRAASAEAAAPRAARPVKVLAPPPTPVAPAQPEPAPSPEPRNAPAGSEISDFGGRR